MPTWNALFLFLYKPLFAWQKNVVINVDNVDFEDTLLRHEDEVNDDIFFVDLSDSLVYLIILDCVRGGASSF